MKEHGDVLPNQVGKPINNPTMKWIAELINMIAVVTIITDDKRHRKKVHQRIIVYLGKLALDIYGLPSDLEHIEINHDNYKNLLH